MPTLSTDMMTISTHIRLHMETHRETETETEVLDVGATASTPTPACRVSLALSHAHRGRRPRGPRSLVGLVPTTPSPSSKHSLLPVAQSSDCWLLLKGRCLAQSTLSFSCSKHTLSLLRHNLYTLLVLQSPIKESEHVRHVHVRSCITSCACSEVGDVDVCGRCVICMSAPKDTTVLPCRHMCMCRYVHVQVTLPMSLESDG